MRYKILNLLLLSFIFSSFAESSNIRSISVESRCDVKTLQAQYRWVNYAVVIGINKYANHPDLSTAVNDANEIASVLKEKYFFNRKNIFLLTDYDATKKNIIKIFEDLITLIKS